MTGWTSPEVGLAVVAALAWLLAPGAIASYALGLRGFVAWAVAPTASTGSIAAAAVVAGALGLRWSPWSAAGLAVVPAVLIVLVRLGLRQGMGRQVPVDPRPVQYAAWCGLLPALAVGSVIVVRGLKTPDAVSQTYDAVFHYNALRWILDSGVASTLTLGALGGHSPHGFYPAAWHDMASLVALSSGAPITVAANMTAGVISVAGWSLACVFLVRQVCGPSVRAMAVTGIVSVGFGAFPWALLDFGVLWPNELGLVLVPVGLGAGLSLLRLAVGDALTRGPACVVALAAVAATGLAEPSATFGLAALLVFPCGVALWRWIRGQHRAGRTARGVFGGATVLMVGGIAWSWVNSVPVVAGVKSFEWATYATTASAAGEVLLNATNGRASVWLQSAALVVGAVVALRRRDTAWLACTHALIAALFIMCAAIQSPMTHALTGFWFNDSHRLAAMLPITGVPLAVGGLTWTASALHDRARQWPLPHAWDRRVASVAACTALLGGVLFADTALRSQKKAAHDIGKSYPGLTQDGATLVDARQLAFFDRIRKSIPPGAVVANNPWNGSALLWALGGARVLFPQLNEATWTNDQRYLAAHLDDAATDPAVCRIVQATGVRFLLIGDFRFWRGDKRIEHYPGLGEPVGRPGFALVDRQGPWRLYRLTACTPGGVPTSGS
jgi:hypothetical protein